jgi:hypothetical protein
MRECAFEVDLAGFYMYPVSTPISVSDIKQPKKDRNSQYHQFLGSCTPSKNQRLSLSQFNRSTHCLMDAVFVHCTASLRPSRITLDCFNPQPLLCLHRILRLFLPI